jgi:hypothetical protein
MTKLSRFKQAADRIRARLKQNLTAILETMARSSDHAATRSTARTRRI